MCFRGFLCFSLSFLIFSPAAWALESPSAKIEDDSALRRSIIPSWFKESPGVVLAAKSFLHTLPGGSRIEVRSESRGNEFSIILARELLTGAEGRKTGEFPGWAQGSWALTRNKTDGSPLHIRVFPGRDPYVYVQFRSLGGGKSQMDVVAYDSYLVQSHPVPLNFDRIMEIPMEEVYRNAGIAFPRRYFDPLPALYKDTITLVEKIRVALPSLSFRDDGALDDQGRYVFINTLESQDGKGGLNCSGFAKWVVDGMLRPYTGTLLPIEPLKQAFGKRGSSFTEPYEALRDPFFGLDWTRNLASRAMGTLLSPAFAEVEEFEVRRAPIGAVIDRRKDAPVYVKPYPGFLLNAGFGVEGLQALLYTLAIDEPGRIYLASVNNEINDPNNRPLPPGREGKVPYRMRQHFHIAVLIPYFNEYGIFRIAVFESAEETAFIRFKNRYPGHYVNLVRIPVEGVFDPAPPLAAR
ncbi:MAG: hypothetical protein LBT16_00805 [Treponema sp.]|jgi:hypothetical protein|nr:hypothetical protein [Treponema sp.]